MESGFRAALCICLFVGLLQARPLNVSMIEMGDLDIGSLREITCKENVTFATPDITSSCQQTNCSTAALKTYIRGLKKALTDCDGAAGDIDASLYTLKQIPQSTETIPSSEECKRNESHKQFTEFVIDLENFILCLKSKNM